MDRLQLPATGIADAKRRKLSPIRERNIAPPTERPLTIATGENTQLYTSPEGFLFMSALYAWIETKNRLREISQLRIHEVVLKGIA